MRNHEIRKGAGVPAGHRYAWSGDADCVVIALDDLSLRAGISDLRWRLDELLAEGQPTLVIDISRVSSLSSATVAAMLWTKRRCQARQTRVVIRGPSRRSLDLLRRTGLGSALDIEPSHTLVETRPGRIAPRGRDL